jgi:hypothetical protein
VGVFSLEVRSRDEIAAQRSLAESRANLKRLQSQLKAIPEEEVPLSEPTTFFYLDGGEVESLYGQYEPELVPAIVKEELKSSSEFSAEASIDEVLTTKAGRSRYESRIIELRKSEKNAPRKTKDLVQYL